MNVYIHKKCSECHTGCAEPRLPFLLKYRWWYLFTGFMKPLPAFATHSHHFFSIVWQPACAVQANLLVSNRPSCSYWLGWEWLQLAFLETLEKVCPQFSLVVPTKDYGHGHGKHQLTLAPDHFPSMHKEVGGVCKKGSGDKAQPSTENWNAKFWQKPPHIHIHVHVDFIATHPTIIIISCTPHKPVQWVKDRIEGWAQSCQPPVCVLRIQAMFLGHFCVPLNFRHSS